jgi:hypothetical protein
MHSRNDWSGGAHASWAIADPDGRAVGSLSLHHLDPAQGDGEVGYWIAPWARGRGFATSAVSLAVQFGFATLRLHRPGLQYALIQRRRPAAATHRPYLRSRHDVDDPRSVCNSARVIRTDQAPAVAAR